ncbi:MAG TPA: 50S ribosomal protein L13 [Chloroflexota bacterium]|nr:50S ribosomal protein L13 [Chloroflexota bacterium]
MSTPAVKVSEIDRKWYTIDVAGKVLGRAASDIAYILRGKHKPNFTPYLDNGDHVIVLNADKIAVTGKRLSTKMYYRHSGYPGGIRETSMQRMMETHPERVIEAADRGMLPRTKLGDAMLKKMRIYNGATHPHEGQTPADIVQVLDAGRGTRRVRE